MRTDASPSRGSTPSPSCSRTGRIGLPATWPPKNFVPFWGEGADSFKSDPPNGTLSVLEGEAMDNVVMTLRDPRLAGRDLSYEVVVLEGKPPASGGAASLFIDIIGMPLTPVSFAGARRRMWRRLSTDSPWTGRPRRKHGAGPLPSPVELG